MTQLMPVEKQASESGKAGTNGVYRFSERIIPASSSSAPERHCDVTGAATI